MAMFLNALKPRQTLNGAYQKVKPNRTEIELFKEKLIALLDRINEAESEEFHKNLISYFLNDTYYKGRHFINTKGRNDLVIHNGTGAESNVGVIIEAKKPTNKAEMVTTTRLNTKAFQELVLYYLRERITHKNLEVKHLVISNIYEWFIFDANTFDRLFAQNKTLVKQFTDFETNRLAESRTDFFYKEIAEPFIDGLTDKIEFTHFRIQDYEAPLRNASKTDDTKLIALYKLLSPEHMLKLPFANDSNSLDKRFYSELLHIIGLHETKDGSKKIIERKPKGERNSGSLLEDAIIQLDSLDKLSRLDKPGKYGSTTEERLFNVGLELVITWINRILFLKLLEAQLITYHKGDDSYAFLNGKKIHNYDDLNSLFFQVLARKHEDRNEDVARLFEKVPYLNSSLFEPTEIEHNTIFISNLKDDKLLPIHSQTVLKDAGGKKLSGEMTTLEYLFRFLEAYDFSSEGSEDIQEDNKTLINASVLGLIFEKINGYKDGSFFTPGFITMYMCRETIRRAVVQKFNESWDKKFNGNKSLESRKRSTSGASTNKDISETNASSSATHLERESGNVSLKGLVTIAQPISPPNNENSRRKIIPYHPELKSKAQQLRKESTKSEVVLWQLVKGKFLGKYDFHRQKPLDHFIADFFCYELSLVIELDGRSHHFEETIEKDRSKEIIFNKLGLNVLRFADDEVLNDIDNVIRTLENYVEGFEKGNLSAFDFENTPLNPLSRGDSGIPPLSRGAGGVSISSPSQKDESTSNVAFPKTNASEDLEKNTPLNPLSRGDFGIPPLLRGAGGVSISSPSQKDESTSNVAFPKTNASEDLEKNTPLNPLSRGDFEAAKRFKNLDDIYDEIGFGGSFTLAEANAIVNSIKICDPAVGSGHFLVSALNEMIAVKNDLRILQDKEGRRLKEYHVEVENDELIITDEDGKLYEYHPNNRESQRVQEALFHEKQTIIENCLFGVDINPNSVKICRLRLWIELLKNAYYKTPDELETLPNIDINIKCGNSLVSRFDLDSDLSQALRKSKWTIDSYRLAVATYRNAQHKEEKREMERLIADIKSDFRTNIDSPFKKKIAAARGQVDKLATDINTQKQWGEKVDKALVKKLEKAAERLSKLEAERDEIETNKIYENAFEWRFEFPEVLDDQGGYLGFDVVIGNPPYGADLQQRNRYKILFPASSYGQIDTYKFFIDKGLEILKMNRFFSYITSDSYLEKEYFKDVRTLIVEKSSEIINIKLGDDVFDEVNLPTSIMIAEFN